MQTLYLSREFLNSLNFDEKVRKTMRIYGFNNSVDFLEGLKLLLSSKYDFININEIKEYDKKHKKNFHMYNGFISGDIGEYDEIIISLSVMKDGKLGNVFVTQQIVPMITSMLSKNMSFLVNKKIKKIAVLTTHLSQKMTPLANKIIGNDNTGSMIIKILNVLGFDVVEFFPIKNSNVGSFYSSLDEFIDHSNFINQSKKMNTKHSHVNLNQDSVVVSFHENEKVEGQTIKFVLLKALAAIHLSDGKYIDMSGLIARTDNINKKGPAENVAIVDAYSKHFFKNGLSTGLISRNLESDIIYETSIPELEYKSPEKPSIYVQEYLRKPEYAYNSGGKQVFKTYRDKKLESFELHNYMCSCHDESHNYFISSSTSRNYVEGHHMIPMEYQEEYWRESGINLDSTINIIPLCPNCHQKIHKAIKSERIEIIIDVYRKYEKTLKSLDLELSIEKFASLYNVYIY